MNSMEIILLIIGGLVFVLSFLIPNGKSGSSEQDRNMARDEISGLVDREWDRIRGQVDDTVEEAVNDSVEKIKRSLEKISNEKIMAVNEYSDTVLEQINTSQQEITFLYDMLNAKHDSLKNAASEVEQKIRAAEIASREVEAALRGTEAAARKARQEADPALQTIQTTAEEPEGESGGPGQNLEEISVQSQGELQGTENYINKNDQILELHRQGWSDVTIARQLDLGVGEVKLVIGLFEGRNNS